CLPVKYARARVPVVSVLGWSATVSRTTSPLTQRATAVIPVSAAEPSRRSIMSSPLLVRKAIFLRSERGLQALEPGLEHLVRDREREPRPAGASRAKALTGRDRDAVLEQSLRRQPLG